MKGVRYPHAWQAERTRTFTKSMGAPTILAITNFTTIFTRTEDCAVRGTGKRDQRGMGKEGNLGKGVKGQRRRT